MIIIICPFQVASLFDDSDSDSDLFASASPSSLRSQRSSEPTPSKTTSASGAGKKQTKKSIFDDDEDDDEDLFGVKDAPDLDLFNSAPVKSLSKLPDELFPSTGGLFGDKINSSAKKVDSLFGDDEGDLFGEVKKSNLFGEAVEDDLFGNSKKIESKKLKSEVESTKVTPSSLFSEETDDDLFGATKKTVGSVNQAKRENSSNSISDSTPKVDSDEQASKKSNPVIGEEKVGLPDEDLFAGVSKKTTVEQKKDTELSKQPPVKVDETKQKKNSKSLFEDDSEDSDLFGKVPKTEKSISPPKSLFEDTSDSELFGSLSKTPVDLKRPSKDIIIKTESDTPKKLTTSIFDESDEDDDLFGSSSLSKKKILSKQDQSIPETKKMEEDKKSETEKQDEKPKKIVEKSSIFEEDDDDDDLFGDKKKNKTVNEEQVKTKTEPNAAKAVLAEIKQKLEKQKLFESNKPESTTVDGAVISRKEPPKTLKIQTDLQPADDTETAAAPKKPVVSGKIKNLMGKMDFKILSPTDTPPLTRKNVEEKSTSESELEASGETANSEESTPSLPSGGSSPQTSGENRLFLFLWLFFSFPLYTNLLLLDEGRLPYRDKIENFLYKVVNTFALFNYQFLTKNISFSAK